MKSLELSRRIYFSCGHRYFNPNWDESKNKEIFGLCYSPHGHGHNYILDAYVTGPVDPETGMILNLQDLDQHLKSVVDQLDHKFLNTDVPIFQTQVPTTENIAQFCFKEFTKFISQVSKVTVTRIRLYENEDLWVDVYA